MRQLATLDELVTLVTEIEAIINDRPITYNPSDLEEPIPLTPSMLLYGHMVTNLPQWEVSKESLQDPDVNQSQLRARLCKLDLVLRDLWKRWKNEYLPTLREQHAASKQKGEVVNHIREGDVVLSTKTTGVG